MQGAIDHAEAMTTDAAPQLLAILDRDDGLVLAGIRPPENRTAARLLALDGPGTLARHLGPDTHSSPLHDLWPVWASHADRRLPSSEPSHEHVRA